MAARGARPAPASGWAIFAGSVLFIAGFLSFFYGLAAVLNDEVVTVGGGGVIIADFSVWGWVHLLVGVFMVLTALGLFTAQEWSRWSAIFFAMVNAILQVGVITAFPLWSILVIALDVIVIYQLTANWPERA